jgi:hypothetical protein
MVKKKVKEELKRPDVLITAVESSIQIIRSNLKFFIMGAVVFCIAAISVYGYTMYAEKRNEKAQVLVAEGAKSLEQYAQTGKKEDLDKAETIFQKVVKERRGKVYQAAELYLGTVYVMKGRTEDAKKIYQELSKDSPAVIKMLANRALQNMTVK